MKKNLFILGLIGPSAYANLLGEVASASQVDYLGYFFLALCFAFLSGLAYLIEYTHHHKKTIAHGCMKLYVYLIIYAYEVWIRCWDLMENGRKHH